MTRYEALRRISELSCSYQHVRMTDCPHCAAEVESLVNTLMASQEPALPPPETSAAQSPAAPVYAIQRKPDA